MEFFVEARNSAYPIPSMQENESDKFLTGLMHVPWVLRFKLGSLWPAVKWQAFGSRDASEYSEYRNRCLLFH